ncbi:MAG: cytochrome c family protein [Rickettsiales bacterium]|nr:cytochrome c family protein [Rickettsiales bacterium]
MSGSDLEFNKLMAAVLIAGLLAIASGKLSGLFYSEGEAQKRGYEIAVADDDDASKKEEPKEEVIDIAALMKEASAEKGKKIAKRCVSCHAFEQDGKNKIGPKLWNVLGSQKAAVDGYKYSAALTEMKGQWGYDEMFAFLKAPKKYVPGTKMNFAGLRKPKDIANLVAYMREYSETPLPLPEPAAVIKQAPEEVSDVIIPEDAPAS